MTISWFPGHMHKARKALRKLAPRIDLYVELLDARAPIASTNPELPRLFADTPALRVLTKADLADSDTTRAWQAYFQSGNKTTCLLSSKTSPLPLTRLLTAADGILGRSNPASTRARQMVITGIPNVGKSTLLNQLLGRKLARTGNEPAVTREQQRVRLDPHWVLFDTPGLMWPKLENQQQAYLLAMLGCIRNTAIDSEDIAWHAADWLLAHGLPVLQQHYGLSEPTTEAEAVLQAVARSRGAITRGGQPDWPRTAELLLNDLRSGKLGRLSLESPPT